MYSAETDSEKGKGSYVATPFDYVAWTEGDIWSGKPWSPVWCRFFIPPLGEYLLVLISDYMEFSRIV